MRIESIGAAFPSRIVSNAEVVEMIRAKSKPSFEGNLEGLLAKIDFFLGFTGSKNRRWLGAHESALGLTLEAMQEALESAGVRADAIDLVVYASLDRRVVEPGQSFFLAKALGMTRAECFDVIDACNGWTRALRLVHTMLRSGGYERVLVVTSEFGAHEGQWGHDNFRLASAPDLDWSFPSYTLGEAATATLLVRDDARAWHFDFETRPQHAHLCMCPITEWEDAVSLLPDVARTYRGPRRFVSYAKEMHDLAWNDFMAVLARSPTPLCDFDVVFPHTQSKKIWDDVALKTQTKIPYHYVFQEYGNVVTGSIPAAMRLAERESKLARGQHVAGLMAAAGISYGMLSFRY